MALLDGGRGRAKSPSVVIHRRHGDQGGVLGRGSEARSPSADGTGARSAGAASGSTPVTRHEALALGMADGSARRAGAGIDAGASLPRLRRIDAAKGCSPRAVDAGSHPPLFRELRASWGMQRGPESPLAKVSR